LRVGFDLSAVRGFKTGIGVYTDSLLRALKQYAPEIEPVFLDDGAAVNQRTDARMLREQFTLPQLAARANAELIHLTGFAAPLASRVPVVLTVMDLIGVLFARNFPFASRMYWSQYLPFTLRGARHIVTLSQNTKLDVMRLTRVPPNRISVVPPGVDERFCVIQDQSILESTRARLNLPAKFFLFVSTLEPRKGIDVLIQAYEKIWLHAPEHLVIVGKRGWYYSNLFAQARAAGLETRVHFLDYVADTELPALYNLATAFVFPSRYEGFGLTPLEAMACGTPVITSNVSSLPEVVGDAGVLMAPNNVTGFAHAMLSLAMNEAQRVDLHVRGIKRAHMFSWQKSAEAMAQLYLMAAAQSKKS
jgi:glycosyltransferase involved in cell wall biosynthesis